MPPPHRSHCMVLRILCQTLLPAIIPSHIRIAVSPPLPTIHPFDPSQLPHTVSVDPLLCSQSSFGLFSGRSYCSSTSTPDPPYPALCSPQHSSSSNTASPLLRSHKSLSLLLHTRNPEADHLSSCSFLYVSLLISRAKKLESRARHTPLIAVHYHCITACLLIHAQVTFDGSYVR